MSLAIKSIVDGYVRLNDRNSLEDLRQHRQSLRRQVNGQGEYFDVSRTIQILDEDIRVIEAGIGQL
jgi:hypothetical protein